MDIIEFETELRKIRAKNGWTIELELLGGIWGLSVYDKDDHNKKLGSTGTTSLSMVISCLNAPFDKCPWV